MTNYEANKEAFEKLLLENVSFSVVRGKVRD